MPDSDDSLTSKHLAEYLQQKGSALSERDRLWQALDNKKNRARDGNGTDDDDRQSVLSSRIMRSGLTNIGQLAHRAPQSDKDRRALEAAMRDPRYLNAWRKPKPPQPLPEQRQPGPGQLQPHQPQNHPGLHRSLASLLEKPQQIHRQQQHHQNPSFPSRQAVDSELVQVLQKQKDHLLEAVDCDVRIKELYWHRHAMMEREESEDPNKTKKKD